MTTLETTSEKGRVRITATALDGTLITVTRKHPSGRVLPVRGMTLEPLSGGAFLGWDYEMPIGVPVVYQAAIYSETDPNTPLSTSAMVTFTWATDHEWLKDPLEPIRNMQVNVEEMVDYDYPTRAGVHDVLGRPTPVTIGEIRQAATGEVLLVTLDQEQRDRLHYITASGHALLLQSTQAGGVGSMYIQLLGIRESRVSRLRDEQMRRWTLQYVEVSPPAGAAAAFVTWADVLVQYPDWQTIVDGYTSWVEFIEGVDQVVDRPILAWRGA